VVAIVAGNLPTEKNVLHSGALANVVNNHVVSAGSLPIDNNADGRHVASEIPGNEVSRFVVL